MKELAEVITNFGLAPRIIRGKTEFEIFKNYINDIPEKNLVSCVNALFSENKLKGKSNVEAEIRRTRGNVCFGEKKFKWSLHWYTKSLCYATYNGEEYALALGNRSAVFFEMNDYESCIKDINLCLQAKHSNELKTKILIRKAKCFKELGKQADMRKILLQALNLTDDLPESTADKYKQTISDLITTKVLITSSADNNTSFNLPTLEENPLFLNASNAINFQYSKKQGYRVVATKEIKRGDVLFVEKAFAFAPTKTITNVEVTTPNGIVLTKMCVQKSCQYCLSLLTSCIPCKSCVKHLYCNDECRVAAWEEFHQWECIGVRAGVFSLNNHGYLAFRIILKAVFSGSDILNNSENQRLKKYGEKDNNYSFLYNLPKNIDKIDNNLMIYYVATAAMLTHYLKAKTTFFDSMKKYSSYVNKNDKELMKIIGSLLIRHSAQLHCNLIPKQIIDVPEPPVKTMVAMTMCPSVAIMKHSCLPNTAYYFIGDTIVVKATEDIKANEEIYRSYSSALKIDTNHLLTYEPKEIRTQLLKTLFFLDCNCKICIDPKMNSNALDAYSCIACRGPAVKLEFLFNINLIYECLNCHFTYLLPHHIIVKERIAGDLFMRFMLSGNIEEANRSLEISKTIFVSSHVWFETLYTEMEYFHLQKGNINEFLELVKEHVILGKKRYINFEVETAVEKLLYCMIGIKELAKYRPHLSLQNLRASNNTLKELLKEVKEILNLYYPLIIPEVNKTLKSVQEVDY